MTPSTANSQKKNQILHSLFLLQKRAQKKKLSKRKRRNWAFALCGARQELRALDVGTFPKRCTKTLMGGRKNKKGIVPEKTTRSG